MRRALRLMNARAGRVLTGPLEVRFLKWPKTPKRLELLDFNWDYYNRLRNIRGISGFSGFWAILKIVLLEVQ
jgi:hypothetical protein